MSKAQVEQLLQLQERKDQKRAQQESILRGNIESLNNQLVAKTTELESLKPALDKIVDELLQSQKQKDDKSQAEVDRLTVEKADLQSLLERLNGEKVKTQTELEKALTDMQDQLRNKETEHKEALATKQGELDTVIAKNEKQKAAVREKDALLVQNNDELARLNEAQTAAAKKISALQECVENLESVLKSVRLELAQNGSSLQVTLEELLVNKEKNAKLQEEKGASDRERAELNQYLAQLLAKESAELERITEANALYNQQFAQEQNKLQENKGQSNDDFIRGLNDKIRAANNPRPSSADPLDGDHSHERI